MYSSTFNQCHIPTQYANAQFLFQVVPILQNNCQTILFLTNKRNHQSHFILYLVQYHSGKFKKPHYVQCRTTVKNTRSHIKSGGGPKWKTKEARLSIVQHHCGEHMKSVCLVQDHSRKFKNPEKVSQMAQWQNSSQGNWDSSRQGYETITYY